MPPQACSPDDSATSGLDLGGCSCRYFPLGRGGGLDSAPDQIYFSTVKRRAADGVKLMANQCGPVGLDPQDRHKMPERVSGDAWLRALVGGASPPSVRACALFATLRRTNACWPRLWPMSRATGCQACTSYRCHLPRYSTPGVHTQRVSKALGWGTGRR